MAVGRNALAAELIDALANALARFDEQGFDAFLERWPAFDMLRDRPVRLIRADQSSSDGTARGIDRQGRLMFEADGKTRPVAGGEVSVRVR